MPVPTTPAPHDPLFDDAWLKWGWAVSHAKALQAEVLRALHTHVPKGLTTRAEYHPKLHGFSVHVETLPALPDSLGLRLGDVFHGFRSALDNAAWAVVKRGRKPPHMLDEWQRRKVAFPCADTAKELVRIAAWKIPGASAADLAVIRSAQPYQLPKRRRAAHVLPVLIEKNDIDKHKTIQPVLLSSYKLIAERILVHHCIPRRLTNLATGPLQVGTEVARLYVRPDPTPALRCKASSARRYRSTIRSRLRSS